MTAHVTPFIFKHSTRRVIYDVGALAQLGDMANARGARAIDFVVDGFVTAGGLSDKIAAQLDGFDTRFHAIPPEEPDTEIVEAVRAFLADGQAEMIVAIGGGSAMDAAKVARMLLSNPGEIDAIAGAVGVTMIPHDSLFVCVPTTAGTGSEVSEYAVIGKAGTDYKMVFHSPEMAAAVAILDPALGTSAPAGVTAGSGMDAITHAIEAYTSNFSNLGTDPLAHSAIKLLARSLAVAYREPDNLDARGECLIGSMQAAMAFNGAGLGLAHAVSGALGAQFHVAHGLANALALPWTMAFNHAAMGDKGAEVARLLGASTAAEGVSRLRHQLGLDLSLDQWVKTDAERDAVAKGAATSPQIRFNPRAATEHELRIIIEAMRTPTGGSQPNLNL